MAFILNIISTFIANLIDLFGYGGLALAMALESCNPFLPSEIIQPFAGYLAAAGTFNFWGAVLAGSIGGTAGALISYYLGRYAINSRLCRWISGGKVQWLISWFERYGESAVFFGRLIPMIRTFISLPAGAAQMSIPRFLIYTFAGSSLWSMLLTYLGFIMGENWSALNEYFDQLNYVLITGLLVLTAAYFIYHHLMLARPKRKVVPVEPRSVLDAKMNFS